MWNKANTAYINGDFHAAADTYEELLSRGVSSMKLYYNLGNAYFKDDRIGKAILYYNRALRLAPGNDDIRYNLSVAEARTKDNIEDIPEFFFVTWMRDIRHMMGCTAWSLLSLALLACMLGLFLVYLLAQRISLRKAGFYGTVVAALLFLLALATVPGSMIPQRSASPISVMDFKREYPFWDTILEPLGMYQSYLTRAPAGVTAAVGSLPVSLRPCS